MKKCLEGVIVAVFILLSCYQPVFAQEEESVGFNENKTSEIGLASWYGPGLQNNKTARGEVFNMDELTAAHPTLPFGTRVRVTNLRNKKSVIVRINDRGPFIKNRIIDLSKEAARRLDMLRTGVTKVRVEVLRDE